MTNTKGYSEVHDVWTLTSRLPYHECKTFMLLHVTVMLTRGTSIVAETLNISALGRVYNFLVSMTGVGICTVRSANTRAFFANLHFYIFLKLYCCTEMNIFVVFLLISCVLCEILISVGAVQNLLD